MILFLYYKIFFIVTNDVRKAYFGRQRESAFLDRERKRICFLERGKESHAQAECLLRPASHTIIKSMR
jgi:hypothetical protein